MGILIKKAWYGYAGEAAHDVTQAVIGKMSGTNNITFTINAQNLGLSGLSNNARQLTVIYAYGTVPGPGSLEISKSGLDGQTMTLYYAPTQLIFTKVTYGTEHVCNDITTQMQRAIFQSPANMVFQVGSSAFLAQYGGDPAPNIQKVCCIYYTFNGSNVECIMARDGDNVNLNTGP